MPEKKKITYEQDLALASGRSIARMNQRERMARKEADRKAQEERERFLRDHLHGWSNWAYDFEAGTETRTCRHCHESETRLLSEGTFKGI